MNKVMKQQSKRAEMTDMIRQQPGITSGEIAERMGLLSPTEVSNALWKAIRSGKIVPERVLHNGRNQNAYYLFEQLPPDAAERVHQRTVGALDAEPIPKPVSARNSVFDVPATSSPARQEPRPAAAKTQPSGKKTDGNFACALTSDGSLVLIREGQIEFALSGAEAATLQSYLVKRAAANLFASMA